MNIDLRTCTDEDIGPFLAACEAAFGSEVGEGSLDRVRNVIEPERSLAAWDHGSIVGTAGAYTFSLSIPGGDVPAAGVTMVGVLPTHRRRGILTRMMESQLADVHGRGEPVAVLWASEASIYQRFGYGPATLSLRIEIAREHARWLHGPTSLPVARLLDLDEALKELPSIYEQARTSIPGMVSRTEAWWAHHRLADPKEDRDGAGPMFRVLIESEGRPAAYALYRKEHGEESPVPGGKLRVLEAIATTPRSHTDLWSYLFGIDLIATIHSWFQPVDSPLLLGLQEVNRLSAQAHDGSWLRIVDVEAALRARDYHGEGRILVAIEDALCPWNEGVWSIDVSGGRAEVARSQAEPMIRLRIRDLACVYLGGFTFHDLGRAGRADELVPGALDRAARLFQTERKPWCPEIF